MTAPRHSTADGSFRKSAGATAARGAAILAAAVILGVILLNKTDSPTARRATPPPSVVTAVNSTDSTTTVATVVPTDSTPGALLGASTTTLASRGPADVKVLVSNGSGVRRAGSRVAGVIKAAGWTNILQPTTAASSGLDSKVYFTPGYETEATAIAAALTKATFTARAVAAPVPTPVGETGGANVVIVVGKKMATAFKDVTPL